MRYVKALSLVIFLLLGLLCIPPAEEVSASRSFGTLITAYQTDAYSGVDADVTTETNLIASANMSTATQMQLWVKANSSGTTDNFVVNVYGSLDGTNFTTVVEATATITATGGGDVSEIVILTDPAKYLRVTGQRSGSTDSFDVECKYITIQ